MKQHAFLIDVGGTYLKGAAFNRDYLSPIIRVPMPPLLTYENGAGEIDPDQLIASIQKLIFELEKQFGKPIHLRFTGQMGGLVLVSEIGRPLTRIISWQDSRTLVSPGVEPSAWETFREEHFDQVFLGSGRDIKPRSSIVQLVRIAKDFSAAQEFTPLSLLGFVANYFAGTLKDPDVHITDAAATGMVNIFTGEFNQTVLRKVHKGIWPPRLHLEYGSIESASNLFCPVFLAVGDQQVSLEGASISDDSVVVNVGTGGQVAKLSSNQSDSTPSNVQIRPFFRGSQISTITHLPAGRILSKYVSVFEINKDVDRYRLFFQRSATEGPSISIDLDDFELSGIDHNEIDPSLIARSVLREMVNRYSTAVALIDPDSDKKLVFAGGVGQKYSEFSSSLAKKSGRSFHVSLEPETTLVGLAKLTPGD